MVPEFSKCHLQVTYLLTETNPIGIKMQSTQVSINKGKSSITVCDKII